MIEIRWHGRGGQGTKTASLLLAEACFNLGKYVQGFPEYGPERMGAPITAYNRISDKSITLHSNIYYPDFVVVVDETLIDSLEVTKGIKDDGILIVNSKKRNEELKRKLSDFKGKTVTIDAKRISLKCLGKYFPNTPMLAAVVKVTGVADEEEFITLMEQAYKRKFSSKPDVIEGNMMALKMAFSEVIYD